MPSDSELIDRILAGERQTFAELVQRYERLARATAMRSVHDSHHADDVAQEAFVAAFQSLSSLRDKSRFGPWLMGIVRRKAARAAAQRSRSPVSTETDLDTVALSDGKPTAETLELLELVEQLPEQERIVIGLRHFDGHSTQEIASITGRPLGTITKQLSRARERLNGWLTAEYAK